MPKKVKKRRKMTTEDGVCTHAIEYVVRFIGYLQYVVGYVQSILLGMYCICFTLIMFVILWAFWLAYVGNDGYLLANSAVAIKITFPSEFFVTKCKHCQF